VALVKSDPLRLAVDACAASHRALGESLSGLTDSVVAQPSLLPGWSVGHVLTHIARNADGLARMVDGAARGDVAEMYPGGIESRNADIEAGARRSAADLVADVDAAGARLDALFDAANEDTWTGSGETVFGVVSIRDLPVRRRHEVEIHRVDLGLGYTFSDWPAEFLRAELIAATGQWASRKPMGLTELPAAALALSPEDRLAWLIGRLEVDGLSAAGIS
jgi:maleylpyruvate isomerase